MNMNIAAEAVGVSSVMLSETGRTGLLDAGYLKEKLGLPERVAPLLTMVFGYRRGPAPVCAQAADGGDHLRGPIPGAGRGGDGEVAGGDEGGVQGQSPTVVV